MAIPDGVSVEGGTDEKPRVTLPGGDPPGELVIHDVVEGEATPSPRAAP